MHNARKDLVNCKSCIFSRVFLKKERKIACSVDIFAPQKISSKITICEDKRYLPQERKREREREREREYSEGEGEIKKKEKTVNTRERGN